MCGIKVEKKRYQVLVRAFHLVRIMLFSLVLLGFIECV